MGFKALLICAAVGAFAAGGAGAAAPRGGNLDLFVMNADGSGQIDVTNHPSFDADPAWSDGSARAERAAYLRRVRGPVP